MRPARRAWVEQLWAAAAALLLLPVLNVLITDRGLVSSLLAADWAFAGVDLTLLALGGLHAWMAIAVLRYAPVADSGRARAEDDR